METIYRHIERIPESKHPSLQGYNAADELLLEIIPDLTDSISIYNDQFGFLFHKPSTYATECGL